MKWQCTDIDIKGQILSADTMIGIGQGRGEGMFTIATKIYTKGFVPSL